jgi:hypothetical protein
LESAIDSRMRIKSTTYSDVQQKPCQFYWHGLLHITIGRGFLQNAISISIEDQSQVKPYDYLFITGLRVK